MFLADYESGNCGSHYNPNLGYVSQLGVAAVKRRLPRKTVPDDPTTPIRAVSFRSSIACARTQHLRRWDSRGVMTRGRLRQPQADGRKPLGLGEWKPILLSQNLMTRSIVGMGSNFWQ